jgi:serine/threonine protein kinase
VKQPTAQRIHSDELSPPDALDGDCLAEDVLHALALGELDVRERSQALAHLDACDLCQTLLAEEARALPEFTSSDDGLRTLIHVGDLVGERYRIKRFVARGGMGEVYEAWDVLLRERVALKTINPAASVESQNKANARFRREAQLARRVGDPHVCRIYEFGQHSVPGFGPLSYLTMELIEGQTLGERLRKGPPLSMTEVMELSLQMLRGLSAAHAVGVLHRDLKSDNVMLRADSASSGSLHAVIMDFGLARVLGDEAHGVTERHELVGSAAYMAPEQLDEVPALSQATDVYAFGVVLYEMLTRRLPFAGKSAMAVAMRRLTHEARPPSHHVPELPACWDDLVMRCLERDVERRYHSADQVREALDAITQRSTLPPPEPAREPRKTRAWVVASIGVLVAAAAYLSFRTAGDVSPSASEVQSATLAVHPAAAPSSSAPEGPDAPPPEAAVGNEPPSALLPSALLPAQTLPAETLPAAPAAPPPAQAAPRRRERLASSTATRRQRPAPTTSGEPQAPAQPEQPTPSSGARDVRDVFFLEQPGAGAPQNSKE